MKKTLLVLVSIILLSVLLIGCGTKANTPKKVEEPEENQTDKQEEEVADKAEGLDEKSDKTLPDDFPKDFPFPDDFTFTDVNDKSDGDRNHYVVSVDFDPAIDMEPVFDLYKAHADKLGYNIVLGGEEYFAEDMFQFGANNPKSANDMFIVTMKTKDGVYGSIDIRFTDE